ncbi:MAG: IS4 family transposase [Verrucomicrobiaceae bacterium]|nr:IS4 family transposase [Verrucomicrobiaceae bacterium]
MSHLGTMIFAQLAHALSLNDICDWLRLKTRAIAAFGLTPPSRNNLSHANKERDARFTEPGLLAHARTSASLRCELCSQRPGRSSRAPLHRFKVRIHAVDSTVMELVANCMGWARHRRRKAAAKMHLRLSLNSFLPTFAIVGSAGEHDNKRARELCAGLKEGEVVVFDKAYVDFAHLHDLDLRGVQWVTRAKDNLRYRALRNLPVVKGSGIVKDQIVKLTGTKWKSLSGWTVRRVEAWVEVDGEKRLMVFITNNTHWSPRSVCDLYRARWDIEVFFKQVKQTLKLGDFFGAQRQRDPLAGVDSAAGVCAAALRRTHEPVGPQLHAALCCGPRVDVGTARSAWRFTKLWDSRWQFQNTGQSAYLVVARV